MEKAIIKIGHTIPFIFKLSIYMANNNIGKDMDIKSIKLLNANSNIIKRVIIIIGGQSLFYYVGEEINNMKLPEAGIYSSRLNYHSINISFEFNSNISYNIPDIEIEFKPKINGPDRLVTPFWDKLLINPKGLDWENDMFYYIDRYGLQSVDNKSLLEHYNLGKPFYAKIKYNLIYMEGMVGSLDYKIPYERVGVC